MRIISVHVHKCIHYLTRGLLRVRCTDKENAFCFTLSCIGCGIHKTQIMSHTHCTNDRKCPGNLTLWYHKKKESKFFFLQWYFTMWEATIRFFFFAKHSSCGTVEHLKKKNPRKCKLQVEFDHPPSSPAVVKVAFLVTHIEARGKAGLSHDSNTPSTFVREQCTFTDEMCPNTWRDSLANQRRVRV